jgi:hypothetical protein
MPDSPPVLQCAAVEPIIGRLMEVAYQASDDAIEVYFRGFFAPLASPGAGCPSWGAAVHPPV